MSHERILRCQSATFHIDGATYQIVANDEPTNGVKILRRRDPPVDLHTDLPTLSNMSVVQRLKLILEKLESGQLDQVPPEVLQKNIQYAIQLIQDGDPLLNKDRSCEHVGDTSPSSSAQSSASGNTAITTTTTTTAPSPYQVGGGGGDGSSAENAFNKLSHIRHQQLLQSQQQHQQQFKRQSSTPCPSSAASSTSCVATSAALIAAATASALSPKKSTNLTTTIAISADAEEGEICASSTSASTIIAAAAAEVTLVSPEQNLSSSKTTTTPTTPTSSTTKTPCVTSSTSTDLPNVNVTVTDTDTDTTENTNIITTPTTIVAVTAPSSTSSGGNDNDNTTQTPPPPPSAAPPTIVTPTKTGRRGSKVALGGAADDTLSVPESRRRDESDNELSEVDEEVIPEEVRKWLASTFTKTVQPKPRLEPRPRFRSVANAIRVGLFVDRFYRQLSTTTLEIPPDVQHHLKEVNNWHFDIFRFHEKSTGHSLKYVGKELFSRYGIVSRFRLNLDKLENFLTAIEFGYTKLKNPYHNDIHAADVTQTLHYFIGSTGLANMFTDLEIFSLLFAALIHDFEHTGRTNNFHVNVGTDLALLYNDRSVLENHHVSAAFRLLKEDDKSILSNLKPEEFRDFRNLVVEMVLSTDMSTHFVQLKNVRAILNGEKVSSTTTMSLMSLLLHTADISHPGKPWRMHKKFADTILEEFFLQGDEEAKLGLPFSPLCDRNSVLIPESQIGFIEFIVEPSLTIMTDLIDFVLNVDDSGPMTSTLTTSSSAPSSAKPQTDNSDSSSDPNNKSSKPSSSVTNSSAAGNANNNASTPPASSSETASSAAVAASNINSDNKNASSSTSTISRVPPPVPLRLGQQKSQIKPFQNLSANSGGADNTRQAQSENCIKTAASSDTNKNSNSGSLDAASGGGGGGGSGGGGGGGRLSLSSRTPSFPLQSGANHNYGPVLRPWINHLCENKAKWRMISAEAAAAAAATVDNENAEEENS